MSDVNTVPDNAVSVTTDDNPTSKDEGWLRHVRERWQLHQSFWGTIHNQAREDDRFMAGQQWPEQIKKDREDEGRPCLTYNLLPAFSRQIVNRIRQDSPTLKVVPVETDYTGRDPRLSNIAGNADYSLADVLGGIIKNIDHQSRSDQAYDTAIKHAVDHGFGFFYLMPEWNVRDPFVQTLRVRRVKDSYTVTLDPEAEEADFRDAQDGFMYTRVNKATFEHKYPNAMASNFVGTGGDLRQGWYEGDDVTIAQYFWIEYKDDEVVRLSNGRTYYWSMIKNVYDELEEEWGIHIIEEQGPNGMEKMRKHVKRPAAMWAKLTYADVLEGPKELPFSAIPIFVVTGDEIIVDGKVIYESAFRHVHDAQRSYNYWRTAGAEAVALAPKAPYVIADKQLRGYEAEWETANETNKAYLPYRHIEGVSPPQRQFPSGSAAAELQNAIQDGVDIQTIIGLHDASLGREGNEKSGRAIAERKAQGATSTFQFPDNLSRAQMQCGRLMIEGIVRLYDSDRVQRIRLPDDSEDFVRINQKIKDEDTGTDYIVHDISLADYDVVMDTGPSYQTQSREAADLQMELLKVLGPDRAAAIVHLIVKNLNVPGSQEVYEILRKMLPDNLKTQAEREADLPKGVTINDDGQMVDADGQPWEPPPTPEQRLAQRQQEIDEAKAQAEQATAQAKIATAEADKEQARAKIATAKAQEAKAQLEFELEKIQLGAEQRSGEAPAGAVDMDQFRQIVEDVMRAHEEKPDAHKDATKDMAAELVTEALKRIKTYVDDRMDTLERAAETTD